MGRSPAARRVVRAAVVIVGAACVFNAAGCGSGKGFLNENDRLRRENMELTERAAAAEQRAAGLEADLAAARTAAGLTWPEGVDRPVCASVEIDGLSGGVDTDADGIDDILRLYVVTLDGKRRFVQTVGQLRVTAAAIEPGQEALTAAARTLSAAEFDAAYRSGLTGTHYTVEFSLGEAAPRGIESLTVRVALTDASNGRVHEAGRAVKVKR